MHVSGYSVSEQSIQLEQDEGKGLDYSSESFGNSQLDYMTPESSTENLDTNDVSE